MKNRWMKNLLSAALLAVVPAMAISALAEVVYENDFETRTSTRAVPYGDWREQPYVTGSLVNANATTPFADGGIQDGWIRANNNSSCPIDILDDGGNNAVVFYKNDTTNRFAVIKQRIGNTFTNGIVAVQCDFRTPESWVQNGQATLTLGDEAFFSPNTSNAEALNHRVAQTGIIYDGSDYKLKFWHRHSSGTNVKETGPKSSTWYRLVVTFNLDNSKWSCDFYDLGASHPTLDTPTPSTAAFSRSNIDITSSLATVISSFGIDFYYPQGNKDSSGLSKAGFYDNIRVSHNGVECYVNDFNARRSRVFGGTTTATYEANGLLVTNTVGTDTYVVGRDLYSATSSAVVQPVGTDGWRRINSAGPRTFSIFNRAYGDTADNPSIGVGDNTSFGLAAQPIGSTLRGGKVRLTADMRTTGTKNDDTNQQGMYIVLGSDDLYNGNNSTYTAGYCARVGLCGFKKMINNLTYRRPHYFENGAATIPQGENEWVKQGTWLRIIVEVDLDAKTYSVEFRDQGSHPAATTEDGTTVYSKTGIGFYKPIDEISCLGLFSYYSQVYFDNIRIWHTAQGASSARLVYENTLTSRTFYHDNIRESSLIGTLSKNPVGQDGWTRADRYTTTASVRNDDANPAVVFGNTSGKPAYAVHDIGMLCKDGEMTTQVDAKPPKYWIGGSRAALFWLGGDRFHEGNFKSGEEFWTYAATFFGFRDAAVDGKANNVYTNVSICAYNGNGAGGGAYTNSSVVVDPTHWYRFVAKTSIRAGESDIAVYDMGTEHPTLATAMPATPVETFTGIKFRRAPESLKGVSSICILAQGTVDNTLDNTVGTFWDNIRISYSPGGMIFIMR